MNSPPYSLIFILIGIWFCFGEDGGPSLDLEGDHARALAAKDNCVKWGNTFDVPIVSKNVARTCKLPDGRNICCSANEPANNGDWYSKPIGSNYSPAQRRKRDDEVVAKDSAALCTIKKVYESSPQELRDLSMADRISLISDDHTNEKRFKVLTDYVLHPETLQNSTKWLERVAAHMAVDAMPESLYTADDYEYLSRHVVTRTCGTKVDTWIEWIEPITITARHPFAFGSCRPVRPLLKTDTPRTGRSNVDYVLLQSGKALFDSSYSSTTGKRLRYSSASNKRQQRSTPVKHYMLDAGTSTFDSSLFWFTCGFAQVGMDKFS